MKRKFNKVKMAMSCILLPLTVVSQVSLTHADADKLINTGTINIKLEQTNGKGNNLTVDDLFNIISSGNGDSQSNIINLSNPNIEEILSNKKEIVYRRYIPYISGYEDNTIRADGSITRGEVAAITFNLYGFNSTPDLSCLKSYSDVDSDDWYASSIAFLTELEIISGYDDGTFRPNAPITRAEMVVVMNAFDLKETTNTVTNFEEAPDVSNHWASEAINNTITRGHLENYADGTFKPNQPATRAEFCTLVNSITHRPTEYNSAVHFSDLTDTNYWAYDEVMNAANYGVLSVSQESIDHIQEFYDINNLSEEDLKNIIYGLLH